MNGSSIPEVLSHRLSANNIDDTIKEIEGKLQLLTYRSTSNPSRSDIAMQQPNIARGQTNKNKKINNKNENTKHSRK